MKEVLSVNTAILDSELGAGRKRQTEREGIKKEVLGLRGRLGSVIRKHVSFPDEFDGHKVKLEPDRDKFNDWITKIDKPSNLGDFYKSKRLSSTTLECETTTAQGEQINITLSSSMYPFKNEEKTTDDPKLKSGYINVKVEQLDYSFHLESDNEAKIYWRKGAKAGDPEDASNKHLKSLGEIINLIEIENPKNKFTAQPYTVHEPSFGLDW